MNKTAVITGSAGFIGFHVSRKLLSRGWKVVGIDCLSDYYDVKLKHAREDLLKQYPEYVSINEKIEEQGILLEVFAKENPNIVVHLAAQAGVRYSIDNPREYLESNIIGTFELLEAARLYPPRHMVIASTSSAYGANDEMPYRETQKSDFQMSFYAATKKSTENMAHSFSHLYDLPITMFRFFTVYGPWGRPDMALFKFTRSILRGEPIDVYNYGDMKRDFTYIDDLVEGIRLLIDVVPQISSNSSLPLNFDNKSPVAPFRVVNIGNSKPQKLIDFIHAIEIAVGKTAKKNMMPIQAGDVPATWADISLLKELTGYVPATDLTTGVEKFIEWYQSYYHE